MKVAVMLSKGIVSPLPERLARSLQEASIETVAWIEVQENDIESATRTFIDLPAHVSAVIGMGGGKALDVAKYTAFSARNVLPEVDQILRQDARLSRCFK